MKIRHQLTAILLLVAATLPLQSAAEEVTVAGPDGNLKVTLKDTGDNATYSVTYLDQTILQDSPLGIITNAADYSGKMSIIKHTLDSIEEDYTLNRSKTSQVHYKANRLTVTLSNNRNQHIEVVMQVSDNDLAFKYRMPATRQASCCVVAAETTGFVFPQGTTTFLCPQSGAMVGWERTKPSYEEEYLPDAPMDTTSLYGEGYTFPCLFHIGDSWALVSETGVDSHYCGSHLSDYIDGQYTIAYPMEGENNGFGSSGAQIALPGETPWRTITVGNSLKPIVETTVTFDVVKELYPASTDYKPGRSTWHWMIWDDASCNTPDIKKFIDLAAAMGYEYTLIDGLWDKQIGYDNLPALIQYGQQKGVSPFLWYNSNGAWNNAPQGPKGRMENPIDRKKEMRWMQQLGVKGIKVDFWAGDKQETMRLYEALLSDANDYGLMVIFHGCTLPRGWERMYPNYAGSEAVLASENLKFSQHMDDVEAFNAALHPFIRNSVGCMEFGGTILNKRLNRNNDGGTTRLTSDLFQLATAVLFQNPIQNFGLCPNNLTDTQAECIEFMKQIPTSWDETRFIDGYPGKYVVLARRHGSKWYVAAINAQDKPLKLKVQLPMLVGSEGTHYTQVSQFELKCQPLKLNKKGEITLTIPTNGGDIIVTN